MRSTFLPPTLSTPKGFQGRSRQLIRNRNITYRRKGFVEQNCILKQEENGKKIQSSYMTHKNNILKLIHQSFFFLRPNSDFPQLLIQRKVFPQICYLIILVYSQFNTLTLKENLIEPRKSNRLKKRFVLRGSIVSYKFFVR